MTSTKNPRQPGTFRSYLFIVSLCLLAWGSASMYDYFIRPPEEEELIAMRDRDNDKPDLYYKNREERWSDSRAPYKYTDPNYYQGRPDSRWPDK